MAIALAATHLAENIKNLALTNPAQRQGTLSLALSNSSNYTGGKLAITLTKIRHS